LAEEYLSEAVKGRTKSEWWAKPLNTLQNHREDRWFEMDSQTWLLVLFLAWGIATNVAGVYLSGIRYQPSAYGPGRGLFCAVMIFVWLIALLWVLGIFWFRTE
jgi:hypothetical protein